MRVGVLDLGSNTARLLVADVARDAVTPVEERKVFLRLGAEIERTGTIPAEKIDEAARVAQGFARIARRNGAVELVTAITAPGRQGVASERLVAALERSTNADVRILTAEDEGRLAFAGAMSRAGGLTGGVTVVDVGGGSTEIAHGSASGGATWIASADLGSLRLARGHLHNDPPSKRQVAAARTAARSVLRGLAPPPARTVLAVGGSARAVSRIVGRRLDEDSLEEVTRRLAKRKAAAVAKQHGIDAARAETLFAGALILAEVSHLLGQPLDVARGGLREGMVLDLARPAVLAA